MSDPFEAWAPVVGQRVRVRISAECALTGPPGSPAADEGLVGHSSEEDGRTGIVWDAEVVNPHMVAQGHRFLVRRDGPAIGGFLAGWYAAAELEPAP